jgi:group II intron reverse transcriptase/maturase
MMEACDVLNIIQEKNRKHPEWKNRGLYRLLYNPTLHIMAYERLKSKPGNMTPGVNGETLDGYSMDVIEKYITLLRQEKYQPTPVRRVYIPKEKGYRPLGVPSPQDKIIQECIRLILDAIYEPQFHDNSHGFRPGRSCHTALESLRRNWVGAKWAIKADITACFEQIDHNRLLDILREKIEDDRFINLVRKFLKAGYLENWEYHKSYSGTPQGSVVSPILSNIYLHKLDQKLAEICERNSRGKYRRRNTAHISLMQQRKQLLMQGEADPTIRANLKEPIRRLNQRIVQTPAAKYNDPAYMRIKFLRYADDVAIGVIGPKSLAKQVVEELATFLEEELRLELNREKTQTYHLPSEQAPFLGYLFKTSTPRFRRRNMQTKGSPHNVIQTVRTTTGNIKLLVPLRKISRKLKRYMSNGQPAKVNGYVNQPVDHIIAHYNGVLRGWYNYYQLAENVCQLN